MKTQIDKLSYTAEFDRLFGTHLAARTEPAKLPEDSPASTLPAWAASAQADVNATQIVQRYSSHHTDEYARVTTSAVAQVPEPAAPPPPSVVPQVQGVSPKTLALILGGAILWLHLEALLLLVVMRH